MMAFEIAAPKWIRRAIRVNTSLHRAFLMASRYDVKLQFDIYPLQKVCRIECVTNGSRQDWHLISSSVKLIWDRKVV